MSTFTPATRRSAVGRGNTRILGWAALFALALIPALASEALPGDGKYTASIDARRSLRIIGTNAPERMVAEVRDGRITVEYQVLDVASAPQKASFDLDAFDRLELDAAGGADFVNIIDPAAALGARGTVLALAGGEGDNVVVLTHEAFKPETAARVRKLLDVAAEIEALARRGAAATEAGMMEDVGKVVESLRVKVAVESRAMAEDAESQLFGPAQALVDRGHAQLARLGDSYFARLAELSARHAGLVADLTKRFDATEGVFPQDDEREPPGTPDWEPDVDGPDLPQGISQEEPGGVREAVEPLAAAAAELGADVQEKVTRVGAQIERDVAEIEKRARRFERRAEALAHAADGIARQSERDLTAAASRVLESVGELKALRERFEGASAEMRDELRRAASRASAVTSPRRSSGCSDPIATRYTYTGGAGADFFAPLEGTSDSWLISGGAGDDILFGGLAADDIRGGPGNDVIFGLNGNDHIRGEDGVDLLVGETLISTPEWRGHDCIWGGSGSDLIVGDNIVETAPGVGSAEGADHLYGGYGTDVVFGDAVISHGPAGDSDTIRGGDHVDLLFGCGGDDTIHGDDDIDFAMGNGGADVIHGGDGRVVPVGTTAIYFGNLLRGGSGNDEMHGCDGNDLMFGGADDDTMFGGKGFDTMYGEAGEDVMHGGEGGQVATTSGASSRLGNLMLGGSQDDEMFGGGDLDVMHGESGDDKIYGYVPPQVPQAEDRDVLLGGDGNDYLEGDDEPKQVVNSTDFMFGGEGNDEMHGGVQRDFMFGQGGDDVMSGDSNDPLLLLSRDVMIGGQGADTMDGGTSADVMLGGEGNDKMKGDGGALGLVSPDLMFGGPGADDMDGGAGPDFMLGGAGDDTMLGDSGHLLMPLSLDVMLGGPGNDTMDGGNCLDVMRGGDGGDTMMGDNSNPGLVSPDIMFGEKGIDYMDGGAGPDFMFGGADDDTMSGDNGASLMVLSVDLMLGNEGDDTMRGGRSVDIMFGGDGQDRMDGEWGADLLWGNDGGDTMDGGDFVDLQWGNGGNDLIHGGQGLDFVWGGAGDDRLYGDDGIDLLWGREGRDCLHGNDGFDVLIGGQGDDRIFGDDGRDKLFGGAGNDVLDGGDGGDWLFGNAGNDTLWGGPNLDLLVGGLGIDTKHQTGSSGLGCDTQVGDTQVDPGPGQLCVHKFEDLDGDGLKHEEEPGVQYFRFDATGPDSVAFITDSDGQRCWPVPPGTYVVAETPQDGWLATTPKTRTVTVQSGQVTHVYFGNQRSGRLCIHKFNDLNGDGEQAEGEGGLDGWTFLVGPLSLVTLEDGMVCRDMPIGTYTVVERPRPDWAPTTPTSQTVTVRQGLVAEVFFGNQRIPKDGTLCVNTFHDVNGDKRRSAGERGLEGWTFRVQDATGANVVTLITEEDGSVCTKVPAGNYTVIATPQPGWRATTRTRQEVRVRSRQSTTVIFGNERSR